MKLAVVTMLVVLLAGGSIDAEPQKLKVYISADMEGIGGVATWAVQASAGSREYEQFRGLMTEEVNAAIAGAFDAGATEVLVSDSHGSGQNIDVEKLDERAKLIRAWPRPLLMAGGIDETFDAAIFIGYHAADGRADGILAHTMGSSLIELKLNDTMVSEGGFTAAIAGDFGVPVVFVSGDQTACREIKDLIGPIETAVVKQAAGFYSATMKHPNVVRKEIREGVKRGLERRHELKPYKVARPVKMELTFSDISKAEVFAYLPGVQRPRGNVVVISSPDMVQASKYLNIALYLDTGEGG
ncbi:MAG: M55 family metallopeptidase [Acidobacteriota bacterium]